MFRARLTIPALLIAIVGVGGLAWYWNRGSAVPPVTTSSQLPGGMQLPAEISRSDYDSAKEKFEAAYRKEADRNDVYSWLGETAFKEERWEVAAASFAQIPSDWPRYGHLARLFEGRALLKLHRARKAEENLWLFLKLEQESAQLSLEHFAEALLQLVYLFGIELRFEDRKPLLLKLIELGVADKEEVLNYCFPTLHRWNGSQAASALEEFWREDQQDARLRVELARYRTGQGRLDDAREILKACRREYPESVSTAAALLACLQEQDEWEEMATIVAELPDPADKHPWLLQRMRGHVHVHQGSFAKGIACFERVVKSNPADVESWMAMGSAYAELNNPEQQQACLNKARQLSRIQNRIGWALDRTDDAEALAEIAEISIDIDLVEEASLVVNCGIKRHPKSEKLLELRDRLRSKGIML